MADAVQINVQRLRVRDHLEVLEAHTAVSAGAVPAKVVQLEQLHGLGQKQKVLFHLFGVGQVVNDVDPEPGTGNNALDLARVGLGGKAVDRVLRLDLGHTHAFQLVVVEQKGVRKLQPRKADRFGAAEHPQEHLAVCGKIRKCFAVDTAAAGKQRAELALQAAARHDGQPGERVTDDRTIHGADGRKRRRTADVKPCADNKVTLDQNFAGHDAFSSPVLDSE